MPGSLHFSFSEYPHNASELSELLGDVSKQVAIAVDNMAEHDHLRDQKHTPGREKKTAPAPKSKKSVVRARPGLDPPELLRYLEL
jgi:predicted ATP-grasp superfamily ATP-dependent carboligase